MVNPYQTYRQVAQVTETSQRKIESAALLAVARDLRVATENWNPRASSLQDVLERNKLLWTIIASEVADNKDLPASLRQDILNLSVFVFKRTLSLMGAPDRDKIAVLININRALADGLAQ